MVHRLSVLIVGLLVVSCIGATATGFADLTGPYLGQAPPGLDPVPFAERLIQFTHSSLSISPDGQRLFFDSIHPLVPGERETERLWGSERSEGGWADPT